ncbi:MAG TPA: TonB-dependent receptor [Bacteroidales bacterium]|nr:TonB-dependent receptor [Bacteroidales bacterium]HQM70309.1 TonB-dependent receptor [Bacteroidales bacterium]
MKRILMFITLVLITGALAMAQTVQISGTVTGSEDGLPLPGVNITVKGTTIGAITGADGKYVLAVPTGAQTLVFSFIGFVTQEVPVQGRTTINIVLRQDLYNVDEVVVVAYGTQQKREITGSIARVDGESIAKMNLQSFDQALSGKAAGVSTIIPNGVLNQVPVIRIRGFNSITSSSNPLVVVDGVPVFTGNIGGTAIQNSLADINPSDIQSMEILKDASATALFGSRAANGVIIITTKRGSGAKTKVTYDGYAGWTEPYRLFDLMNADQYIAHKNLAYANAGSSVVLKKVNGPDGKPIDTNWADYVYQKGFQQSHSITISGSSPTTSYYLSVGYTDQDGMIKKNFYDRKNARMNIDHKVNKYLSLGANIAYTNGYTESPNTGSSFATAGAARLAFVLPPIIAPKLNDGSWNLSGSGIGGMGTGLPAGLGYHNPGQIMETNKHTTESDRILATLSATLEPVKGLQLKTVYGMDNLARETTTFWSPIGGDGYGYGGYAYNWTGKDKRWTWTNTANYNLSLMEKLNIGLLAGLEYQRTVGRSWDASKTEVSDPFFETFAGAWTTGYGVPGGGYGENFYASYFGRANVNWDRRYYLEGSFRRDAYSGLSKDNKWGNFGGVSFMWNVSNEDFVENSSLGNLFSDMRLKLSYGRVGNMFGIGNYSSLFLYGSGLYAEDATLAFSQAGNADLKWETSDKYDVGLSFGILKDRLQADINYFYNDVNNLILNVPQSPSKGIPGNSIPANVGSMYNTGLEFTLTSYNINKPHLSWTTSFNISYVKNEVTELAPGVNEIRASTGGLETTNITVVGKPVGMLLAVETRGVDPQTGRRIYVNAAGKEVLYSHEAANKWTYRSDGSVAPQVATATDAVAWASPLPKFFGGLDNNLNYRNFDVALNLTYSFGFYVYSGSKAGIRDQRWWNNSVEVYEKAWKKPGDITNIPKPIINDNVSNGSSFPITENIEKGDYLKVRSLSAGYTFKNIMPGVLNIESLRIYGQVFNAWVFTKYSGSDPEVSTNTDSNTAPGIDRNTAPQARTYTFGVNVSF